MQDSIVTDSLERDANANLRRETNSNRSAAPTREQRDTFGPLRPLQFNPSYDLPVFPAVIHP